MIDRTIQEHIAHDDNEQSINILRVHMNPIYQRSLDYMRTGNVENLETILEPDLLITITDPSGKVVFSTNPELTVGEPLYLLEALYYDKSYASQAENGRKLSFPLIHENVHLGNLIVEFSKEYIEKLHPPPSFKGIWLAFLLAALLNVIILFFFIYFHKKQIKQPANELNHALLNIVKGNYEKVEPAQTEPFSSLFLTYNTMVEELTFLLKKQQDYDGIRKRFFTVISHELKTPLASIRAYVEGLRKNVAKDEVTREKYVQVIDEKVRLLNEQIEDLFKYAQQESRSFKIHLTEHYAFSTLDPMFRSFEKQLEEHMITFKVNNHLPDCLIKIDDIRIEQVLQNMVNNALKHVDENGQIIITALRENDHIDIVIEDNGKGISPKDLPYIFDYFYQGNGTRQVDYQGVGLGLAICKDIIEKHGGTINVKSGIESGTTFTIRLPIA